MSEISTKPYLLRAIYEWCTDNGYTPYIAASVDSRTMVPREFVKNGEIVLNISFTATSGLKMDNDFVHFHARFGGVSREISIPVDNVVAIYARENGQGMAFEVSPPAESDGEGVDEKHNGPALAAVPPTHDSPQEGDSEGGPDDNSDPPKKGGRPTLTRIK
ncbi:ClpXP protease specificity-enhancing factor [Noviherbaspirillum denitrificans]|uniref:Stringent starvation protein B n=1 Tax=Noviherbaspirillum denitrificans TaxID=1968433 RepID=A0A254T9A2_9BURK|nr:ClpXP protease specificity-enhancing factor [Noviherbaspirillum denitrificans]OWW19226.1 stringent starvation protein B [Noviherbaspirillum denitrificans]